MTEAKLHTYVHAHPQTETQSKTEELHGTRHKVDEFCATEDRRQADAETSHMIKADGDYSIEVLLHSHPVIEFLTVDGEEVLRV